MECVRGWSGVATWNISEEKKVEAIELAKKLETLMEYHFPRAPNDLAQAEMRAVKEKLEAFGFTVRWSVSLNPLTLACKAEVALWLPENNTIQ